MTDISEGCISEGRDKDCDSSQPVQRPSEITGVLRMTRRLPREEAENIRDRFERRYGGHIAVIGPDVEYTPAVINMVAPQPDTYMQQPRLLTPVFLLDITAIILSLTAIALVVSGVIR